MVTATAEARRTVTRKGQAASEDVRPSLPVWAGFAIVAGLYLTLRGYHSFDGDQAYRLPLLLHAQDPSLYATDPFVRAFDAFNPHRGYLAVLGWASRPFGMAAALAGLFALTFAATTRGVDRLARCVWPESGRWVGLVALVLVLAAKAGNIGTNHLFEATLLDRLVGFGLGWLALAGAVADPRRGAWSGAIWLGVAAWIHPSVGLQLALTLAATWGVWWVVPRRFGVDRRRSALAIGALGLALFPALAWNAGQAGRLFEGLAASEFRLLAVSIQGPQHMLPSTWRASQWLAWGCYPVLALLALGQSRAPWPPGRARLAGLMGVNLASLAAAYLAVEVLGDLRATVFQPFRMATLARGLALVAVSGRLVTLWNRGDLASRGRAVLVGVGLGGDWSLVIATAVDLGMALSTWAGAFWASRRAGLAITDGETMHESGSRISFGVGFAILAAGLGFLARHDTESGHVALLAGLGALGGWSLLAGRISWSWNPRRVALACLAAWAVPLGAMVIPLALADPGSAGWSASLVGHCRFAEVPVDDLERLGAWCHEHTPASSRFVGPPGPKGFRLWSRRPLAFNRAGSPYHAEGLADWASRYREHVGFSGSTAEFARSYLADRHGLEAGYGRMTDAELAGLALRQGATHVLVPSSRPTGGTTSPLERLKVEGRYAVDRVRTGPGSVGEKASGKNSGPPLFNPI